MFKRSNFVPLALIGALLLPACSSGGGGFGVCAPDGGECPSDGSVSDSQVVGDTRVDTGVVRVDSAAEDTREEPDTAVAIDTGTDTSSSCAGNACSTSSACCGSAPYCTGTSSRRCSAMKGASGALCGGTTDCQSGLTCVSGTCQSVTCGGDPCSATMPCCAPTPYCTGTVASSANYCRSTAGKSGERCVVTLDCISGLTCVAGRCN